MRKTDKMADTQSISFVKGVETWVFPNQNLQPSFVPNAETQKN